MQESDDIVPSQVGSRRSEAIVATILGILLAVIPSSILARNFSIEMGVGLGMILVPLLALIGWASGTVRALIGALGGILRVFVVSTIGNATNSTLAQKLLLPEAELDWDETRRQSLAVQSRINSANTVEELEQVITNLERRRRFVYRRRMVMIIAAVVALVITGICMLDWLSMRNGAMAFLLPSDFKATEFENLWLIFPVVFVLAAVPLATCFANYSARYLLGCLLLSLYVGTAFYFLFHANLPNLRMWLPPSIVFIVTSGVGLLAEWVSLDDIATDSPPVVEAPQTASEDSF